MHTDISNPLNSRMFPGRCHWAPIHSSVTAGDSSRGNFGEFVQNPALTFRYANNSKLQNVKVELWLYFLFVCGFLVVLPLRAWTCISSLQGWETIPKLLSVLTAAMEKLVCWFYSYNLHCFPKFKSPSSFLLSKSQIKACSAFTCWLPARQPDPAQILMCYRLCCVFASLVKRQLLSI